MSDRNGESRSSAVSCGALLQEIREADGITRQDLLQATGMSRSTLYQRLDLLERAGLIHEAGQETSTGGRPPKILRFDDRGRVALTFDVGHTRAAVSLCRLDGTTLSGRTISLQPGWQPAALLEQLSTVAEALLDATSGERLVGIGLGIPAPVQSPGDVRWPTRAMPDAGYPLVDELVRRFNVPVCVENDARAFALGEFAASQSQAELFLGIKYASGLGAGLVSHGAMVRGSVGAAGDLGHIRITDDGPECTCQSRGCLAAYASGRALLRDLGPRVGSLTEAVQLLDAGDPEVTDWIDTATALLGRALAGLVQALNPREVVFGGYLGRHPYISDRLTETITELTLERVHDHTTMYAGRLGAAAGTLGLVWLVNQTLFSVQRVDQLVADVR
ncbi:ROK family transcriptional regulator [Enemella dayhoffiae]|uniref:ROK family transcriptional regulator n=1 Tax=Enemella dayhoffiae TaxID=2016507 RepID=UPI001596065E|nr:ROK family transcriptional regulator [Enemella dayhoffiae]